MKKSHPNDLPLALSLAVGGHLLIFVLFSVIKVSATPIESQDTPEVVPDEIAIVFEELAPVPFVAPSEKETVVQKAEPERRERFGESLGNAGETPANAEFIGVADSTASSDAQAEQGTESTNALSGQELPKADVKIMESRFQEKEEEAEEPEEFADPEVADETIEEKTPEPEKQPEEIEAPKTKIRGKISVKGEGSLNVKATPVGRYKGNIKKIITSTWQKNLSSYQDHISPGIVIFSFKIDPRGRVYEMKPSHMGVSQLMWGHIVRDVISSKLPSHPADVRKELQGQPLEVIVTITY